MSARAYMGIPREEIPWFPTIDAEACIDDAACLESCANDVFAQGDLTMLVANPMNCVVGCSSCTRICPTDAIHFPDQQELVQTLAGLRQQHAGTRA